MHCRLLLNTWQATAETVDLDAAHVPKEESVLAFEEILPELRTELAKIRHDRDSTQEPFHRETRSRRLTHL